MFHSDVPFKGTRVLEGCVTKLALVVAIVVVGVLNVLSQVVDVFKTSEALRTGVRIVGAFCVNLSYVFPHLEM